jgi:IS30 family transposase
MNYRQLTYEQRVALKAYLQIGLKYCQIAIQLCVNKATISREIQRNRGLKGYRPRQAQQQCARPPLNGCQTSTLYHGR